MTVTATDHGVDKSRPPPVTVRVQVSEGIVTLELARPNRRNALSSQLRKELLATLATIAADPEARVVVLTGAGGHFCAGADLADLAVERLADEMPEFNRIIVALRELPQPVIAKVRGYAVGAGCNLALACDFVMADESATFAQVFSRIGLSPDLGGSWILPRLVGLQQARQLALLGDDVSGRRAAQIGLIMGCVPVDALDTTVNDLARRLASNSAAAQARTKHLLDDALTGSLAEVLGREAAAQVANVATPHFHQALTNFRNSHLGDPA